MELWFTESQSPDLRLSHRVKRVIHREKTPFQELSIVELEQYGRALILEDIVQTSIADEFVYHEMITHMPLNTHPDSAKRAHSGRWRRWCGEGVPETF